MGAPGQRPWRGEEIEAGRAIEAVLRSLLLASFSTANGLVVPMAGAIMGYGRKPGRIGNKGSVRLSP